MKDVLELRRPAGDLDERELGRMSLQDTACYVPINQLVSMTGRMHKHHALEPCPWGRRLQDREEWANAGAGCDQPKVIGVRDFGQHEEAGRIRGQEYSIALCETRKARGQRPPLDDGVKKFERGSARR